MFFYKGSEYPLENILDTQVYNETVETDFFIYSKILVATLVIYFMIII
jgi:hypothetical protein